MRYVGGAARIEASYTSGPKLARWAQLLEPGGKGEQSSASLEGVKRRHGSGSKRRFSLCADTERTCVLSNIHQKQTMGSKFTKRTVKRITDEVDVVGRFAVFRRSNKGARYTAIYDEIDEAIEEAKRLTSMSIEKYGAGNMLYYVVKIECQVGLYEGVLHDGGNRE